MRTLILTGLKWELKSIKYVKTFGKELGKCETGFQLTAPAPPAPCFHSILANHC